MRAPRAGPGSRGHTILARGEPMLWTTAAALMAALLMIGGLIGWILWRGLPAFWPGELVAIETVDGRALLGEQVRVEHFDPTGSTGASLGAAPARRTLWRTGSFDVDGESYAWIADREFASPATRPDDAIVVERASRDRCHGLLTGYVVRAPLAVDADGAIGAARLERALAEIRAEGPPGPPGAALALQVDSPDGPRGARRWVPVDAAGDAARAVAAGWLWAEPAAAWAAFEALRDAVDAEADLAAAVRERTVGRIDDELEAIRLTARELELEHAPPAEWRRAREAFERASVAALGGAGSDELEAARAALSRIEAVGLRPPAALAARLDRLQAERLDAHRRLAEAVRRIRELESRAARHALLVDPVGAALPYEIEVVDVVRAYRANRLGVGERFGVWLGRWWEFVSADPRQANTAGGVFPAIFGTVLMTLLMCLVVLPFGVFAALYLHEYARPGPVVSAIRIAVNNLAGVPSIVFGVFGLGFFCYIVGASLDDLLFRARLPEPTFGKGGLLWAALTLALLTVPVVVVATEEALAAVPNSMRHGSYACGAGRWQTVRRIVLPRALPGIMTGAILAMARGAGEVAPLMLVGAVKYVPDLPIAAEPPFGLDRSFMHLGFHILDQGFQSRNSAGAEPVVYTTTLVLLAIVAGLNLTAVWLRGRFRRRFVTGGF